MKSKESDTEPEVLEPEEKKESTSAIKKPLGKTIHPWSENPLKNAARVWQTDSYTRSIEAENRLMGSMVRHELLRGQLEDIGTEIQAEREERQNRLKKAAHDGVIMGKQQAVEELKLDVEHEELQQRLNQLRSKGDSESDLEAKLKKRHAEKTIKRKYAIQQAMDEIEQSFFLKQEKIRKLNQLIEEIRGSDLEDDEKQEQIRDIERLIIALDQGV